MNNGLNLHHIVCAAIAFHVGCAAQGDRTMPDDTAGVTSETVQAVLGPTVILNAVTGKCIDIPGFGNGTVNGPVNEFTCNGSSSDNQLFIFDDLNIGDGLYNIRNVKDGLCLDVPNFGAVPATTPVSEYFCNYTTADNQLYSLVVRPNGTFWIVNLASNLCLDVSGVRTGGNDARITLFPCSDNDDHQWIL